MATYSEMDEYSQYAHVADGSVFVTFAVAVAGKYFCDFTAWCRPRNTRKAVGHISVCITNTGSF